MTIDGRINELREKGKGDALYAREWNILIRLLRKVLNITGPNVLHTGDGIYFRDPPRRPNEFIFSVQIGNNAARAGKSNQWEYDWREVIIDATDGDYVTMTDGRATDQYSGEFPLALNMAENANDGTSPEGYGTVTTHADATIAVVALASGSYAKMFVEVDDEGDLQYRLIPMNAITVTCT